MTGAPNVLKDDEVVDDDPYVVPNPSRVHLESYQASAIKQININLMKRGFEPLAVDTNLTKAADSIVHELVDNGHIPTDASDRKKYGDRYQALYDEGAKIGSAHLVEDLFNVRRENGGTDLLRLEQCTGFIGVSGATVNGHSYWVVKLSDAGLQAESKSPRKVVLKNGAIAQRVMDIVATQFGVSKDRITPETNFSKDLGADSLDQVELVMELEEEFDINIPNDAAEKIQTVGQAVEYIAKTQK
jgi:acyl carrier protein